jgi:ATP-dependent Clp protease ATP-binding subunit ClpA
MIVTIPIYIEEQRTEGSLVPTHFVRPLFFPKPYERDESLGRAVTKLANAVREKFDELGKQMRHDELAAHCFAPEIEDQLLDLSLDLGKTRAHCRFLFIKLEALGKKLVFSPNIPDLWFEIERGESLRERAVEVLQRYFREREGKEKQNLSALSLSGNAWTTTIDLYIYPPQLARPVKSSLFAMLGESADINGEAELRRVGRCFNWQYPDDLNRAICREREVAELTNLLESPDKRPVLILGPRSVGKTTIIEEYVYRQVAERHTKFSISRNLWLLSPQRLISGMSFVGQWENRLLAIIDEAARRDHVLYFDDLLGMYTAGISASSNLNVAQVIKPYIERQEFRLLGEMTPEAFRVLQEQDRGFADLFQVLRVQEPTEDETFRILIHLIRQLEIQHRCRFDLEALPNALDLQRRYVRDAAFPGKAAAFLRQLAVKFRGAEITRREVLAEFQAKSGMSVEFLDPDATLERAVVVRAIGEHLIGQGAAVSAAADVICTAKARLNDPDRPLGSFLFLGPTGVGKTQCAKAIARYLFGDPEKMLRFDMNEYISPVAVARLVGTFAQPEGLLTSAIRRQPFAVILLDEIEKAHRDVFDLLLQVMGDGRLTDALGRTADFTNAILILTSNLGVKEASSDLGFRRGEESQTSAYVQAAERFFRPEFFNRLDRIVPFERLGRADVESIARQLMREVFSREGLLRRQCILQIDERAMEKIIDAGYHPTLGARALKRAIEKQLTHPVAAQLAPLMPSTPVIIGLRADAEKIDVEVHPLVRAGMRDEAAMLARLESPGWISEGVREFLAHLAERIDELRPSGSVSATEIDPAHYRYFVIREQLRRLERASERLENMLGQSKRAGSKAAGTVVRRRSPKQPSYYEARGGRDLWRDLLAVEAIEAELRELAAPNSERLSDITVQVDDVLRETALLNFLVSEDEDEAVNQAVIYIRPFGYTAEAVGEGLRHELEQAYRELFGHQFGLETEIIARPKADESDGTISLMVRGHRALTLAKFEEGTHLFIDFGGGMRPLQVKVSALDEKTSAGIDPVIRLYYRFITGRAITSDLCSGITVPRVPTASDRRAFLLSILPLPDELLN